MDQSKDWMHCSLCRSGRQGTSTLRKALRRQVEWPQQNTGLVNPIQDPVVYTSLDDAFASMMQFMTISSRKCGRYHNSHKPHCPSSPADKHTLKYHSPRPQPALISNPFSQAPSIQVNTAPGTYSITAARWREPSAQQQTNTTHIIKVEPGESVSLTLSV